MAEETKSKRGGKRPNSGRKASPRSKSQIALKLDGDLKEVFDSSKFEGNRGRYINEAIRAKMLSDGFIREVETKESVVINGVEYVRHNGNNKSSCAQCDLGSVCWDMWHYAAPCVGGFYKKK